MRVRARGRCRAKVEGKRGEGEKLSFLLSRCCYLEERCGSRSKLDYRPSSVVLERDAGLMMDIESDDPVDTPLFLSSTA